jgi:hypothetical protein
VKLGRKATLGEVALRIGDALRKQGIRAVLTGGACAHLRSGGMHTSLDVDLVLTSTPSQRELDAAMADLGFRRRRDRYVHPEVRYVVEFPRGPLALGADHAVRPVLLKKGRWATLALSATDSCRDRLAAFYHWHDRQALSVAVAIALRHPIRLTAIRAWSRNEGAASQCEEFERELAAARNRRRARHLAPRHR